MNTECSAETPSDIADIANKDNERIALSCYKAAALEPPSDMRAQRSHQLQDRGPDICVAVGFSAFKASYSCAESHLRAVIVPLLCSGDILQISWRYCPDESYDFGHHIWRISRDMNTCSKDHLEITFAGPKCPFCQVIWERDAALDEVANLEFQIAQLEEKVRLLEAAQ